MFKKILIVEDHEYRNIGTLKTLKELAIESYDIESYCDDAFIKFKKAQADNNPYDLIITDLSFDEDYRVQNLKSGIDLIQAIREISDDVKIIVFSIEKKPKMIEDLFNNKKINAFVSKSRNDDKVLKDAIQRVLQGETVIPFEVKSSMRQNSFLISDYDEILLQLLAKGLKQQEIGEELKQLGFKPFSQSAIEKRLSELRENLNAKNNIEMISMCKDLGIL
ncbi:response regulator [Soonwooa sp.]|uniref:DNA-binding response regulator n=1 Tax=Soonwooa sp. TaxID=1938592 RepID=UPI00261D35D9|nr:response regulator [Soonwooa sp.]